MLVFYISFLLLYVCLGGRRNIQSNITNRVPSSSRKSLENMKWGPLGQAVEELTFPPDWTEFQHWNYHF